MDKQYLVGGIVLLVVVIVALGMSSTQAFFAFAPQSEKQIVKIGALLPLTGPSSDGGERMRKGLVLAQNEINSDPNKDFNIELIFEDTQYSPEKAVSALQKLINLDSLDYFIGYGSSEVLAEAPIVESHKAILMAPGAQTSKISSAGDYVFRTQTSTASEAKFFAPIVKKIVGDRKIGFIIISTDIGTSFVSDFEPVFTKLWGKIGLVQQFVSTETDFRPYLLKAKADLTTDLVIVATRSQAGAMMKQAEEMGLEFNFYSSSVIEGPELITTGGESVDGVIYPYPFDEDSTSSSQVAFQELFKSKFGTKSEMLSASAYDALNIMSICFEKVGTQTDKVKQCLYDTQNYSGASGIISFDSNGDVQKPFVIKTVKDGKFVKLEAS